MNASRTPVQETARSWVVLVCAFFCHTILFGFNLSFGIYFPVLQHDFQRSKSEIASIGSAFYGLGALSSPIASILYKTFGCRIVLMASGCLACLGCILSYFANSYESLMFTYGIFTAISLGPVFTSSLGVLPDYFSKRRAFATAFTTAGSATGTFLFPPMLRYLVEEYTWKGSMLINAGIAAQLIVLGSIMKSKHDQRKLHASELFETHLFRNIRFWLFGTGCLMWGGIIMTVFALLPDFVMLRSLSYSDSSFVMSFVGAGNLLGRIVSAAVGNSLIRNKVLFLACMTCLYSAAIMAIPSCGHFWSFSLTGAIFGYGFGGMLSQFPNGLIQLFGLESFVNSTGYCSGMLGFGGVLIPIFAGMLADRYGHMYAFYFVGSLAFFVASIFFILAIRPPKPESSRRELSMKTNDNDAEL